MWHGAGSAERQPGCVGQRRVTAGTSRGCVQLLGTEGAHGAVPRTPSDDLDPRFARGVIGDVRHELPRGTALTNTLDVHRIAGAQPRPRRGAAEVSHRGGCGRLASRFHFYPLPAAGRARGSAKRSHPRRILTGVALDPPRTLTPSKVTAFTNCPLAFRYSQIERRPEPPSPHSVKGTLVHAALEGLYWRHAPGERTRAAADTELARAWDALQRDEEFVRLAMDRDSAEAFLADAGDLVANYFLLEDPNEACAVGVELGVEATVDGMRLRGIIDRLDRTPDGRLAVVDYKTGRAPAERFERGSMGGVYTYALLCESLLGRAPSEVRLLYLREPMTISTATSEQSIRGQRRRAVAVWSAIERACDAEDFRPNVGPLCDYCSFKAACPAFAA